MSSYQLHSRLRRNGETKLDFVTSESASSSEIEALLDARMEQHLRELASETPRVIDHDRGDGWRTLRLSSVKGWIELKLGRESNVPKATLIAGMPGSGKTWLLRKLAREQRHAIVFDDPYDHTGMADALADGYDIIAADPNLCWPKTRQKACDWLSKHGAEEFIWYFSENDPEACRANVNRRDDGRHVDVTLELLAKHYVVPEGYEAIPVWRPEDDESG